MKIASEHTNRELDASVIKSEYACALFFTAVFNVIGKPLVNILDGKEKTNAFQIAWLWQAFGWWIKSILSCLLLPTVDIHCGSVQQIPYMLE